MSYREVAKDVVCVKIEKINENQVKIMLTRFDLDERNIKIGELAYGSEKAQELFRDIMEEAHFQCGFESENLPLMIEAIPYSQDNITIIVTKVQSPNDLEERFKQLQKKLNGETTDDTPKEKNMYRSNSCNNFLQEESSAPTLVFSFATVDNAALAATKLVAVLDDDLQMTDMLFKHNNLFYLYIELHASAPDIIPKINPITCEFGRPHVASAYSKYHLAEHGTIIIKQNALKKLSYLGRV